MFIETPLWLIPFAREERRERGRRNLATEIKIKTSEGWESMFTLE